MAKPCRISIFQSISSPQPHLGHQCKCFQMWGERTPRKKKVGTTSKRRSALETQPYFCNSDFSFRRRHMAQLASISPFKQGCVSADKLPPDPCSWNMMLPWAMIQIVNWADAGKMEKARTRSRRSRWLQWIWERFLMLVLTFMSRAHDRIHWWNGLRACQFLLRWWIPTRKSFIRRQT